MNELEMRAFVRQILEVLRKGASLTGTTIDDQTIDMVLRAVDSDLIWGWVYALIQRFLKDEPILVESGVEVAEACKVEAINPLAIIAIIRAVVELWKLLKKDEA